jgi:hypothetical protein
MPERFIKAVSNNTPSTKTFQPAARVAIGAYVLNCICEMGDETQSLSYLSNPGNWTTLYIAVSRDLFET